MIITNNWLGKSDENEFALDTHETKSIISNQVSFSLISIKNLLKLFYKT